MPTKESARLQQAIELHRQGSLEQAALLYEAVLQAEPDNAAACQYLAAIALQRADLAAAAGLADKALALAPDDARVHRLLGQILHRQGNPAGAMENLDRAVALAPDMADAHGVRADVLSDAGRMAEAVDSYDRALALRPDSPNDWCNRGTALQALGRHDDALASYDRAVSLEPGLVEAHVNRSSLLAALGRMEEALAGYDRVLSIHPRHAEALNHRGELLMKLQRPDAALASFQQALTVKPDYRDAILNLAGVMTTRNNPVQAARLLMQGLAIDPSAATRQALTDCIRSIPPDRIGPELEPAMVRMLAETWVSPDSASHQVSAVIRQQPAVRAAIGRLPAASLADVRTLGGHELLGALLVSAPVCDAGLERLLTRLRLLVLDVATSPGASAAPDSVLTFASRLAQQCFINEYVFDATPEETGRIDRLCREAATGSIDPLQIAAIAAYRPLHGVTELRKRLDGAWPLPVRVLIAQQVHDVETERRLRAGIPVLTPIADEVSQAVRQQYEEMPYPRWVRAPSLATPRDLNSFVRAAFPNAAPCPLQGPAELLVAGCGTGRLPILYARELQDRNILAVDLSLSSLAYASRKAAEAGLHGIAFAQADLLTLPSLGRSFDAIDCSGVLHHLADPMAGWRGLVSMLRPGGFMRIALYSRSGRAPINAARKLLAEQGYGSTPDEIRRFRRHAIGSADPQMQALLRFVDFFSVSECRDLLFHVQEHQMTLPDIAAFLDENRLTLLGLVIAPAIGRQYAARFPDDPAMTDLRNWDRLEAANPTLFAGMYQFWVQKPSE